MGVQLPLREMKGTWERYRRRQRLKAASYERTSEPRIHVSETNGMYIERKCMGEHSGTVHPIEERTTAGDRLGQSAQGSAFSWWASMTNAEKDQAVARITGKGKEFREAAKVSGAKRKK